MKDLLCNILLVTDRLQQFAIDFKKYVVEYTKRHDTFKILGIVGSYQTAVKIYEENRIDVVVFVGYQIKEKNYEILKLNPNAMSVLWASEDRLIQDIKETYGFQHLFEKFLGRSFRKIFRNNNFYKRKQ